MLPPRWQNSMTFCSRPTVMRFFDAQARVRRQQLPMSRLTRMEQNLAAHMEQKWAVLATRSSRESVEQKDYRRVIGGSS